MSQTGFRIDLPRIFHHTGDSGDVIYSIPVIRALGGGVLFLSDDNKFPFPRRSRSTVNPDWVNNLAPLLESQDCIWRASFTHSTPFSTDYDLNRFRIEWSQPLQTPVKSIFQQHLDAFGVQWPTDRPWLTVASPVVDRPIVVNLTSRYRNYHFPWLHLIKKYGDQMAFIGSDKEYGLFDQLAYGVAKRRPGSRLPTCWWPPESLPGPGCSSGTSPARWPLPWAWARTSSRNAGRGTPTVSCRART